MPTPPSSKTLKPILKRTPSGVTKTVTFSATNSQVFFADDWDRSAVEVVSKLSYSDVLELKQMSLASLPSDRHASMGLSPLLSHVPLTLCPVADEPKKCAEPAQPPASPLVIPDLTILASPVSAASAIASPPSPVSAASAIASPPSPVSSESSVSALGSASASTSASSPESTPPKTNASLTAPVPRRTLMMNFQPLLPEPGSELPSPVLSASSSLSDASTDTGKTLQTPQTPTTPRTPHTPTLSPIPASPTSPTSPQSKTRTREKRYSALVGVSGEVGAPSPTKSAGSSSPVSPASDTTVSVASGPLVRPVPRRAFAPPAETALVRRASVSEEPVARTKAPRGFEGPRKPLAIASSAWVDGAVPEEELQVARLPIEPTLRSVPLPTSTPTPAPPRPRRSHSMNEALPTVVKYSNPYAQIRETDELGLDLTPQTRRPERDLVPRLPATHVKPGMNLPAAPHLSEGGLGLSLKTSRPPPSSMNRPVPAHRASVHGYPFRPPSPTFPPSRSYPSLSNTPPPQPRPGKPLAAKDANVRGSNSGYTLAVDGGMGIHSSERKPRSANDLLPPSPILAPYCAPMARPKNSKVSR